MAMADATTSTTDSPIEKKPEGVFRILFLGDIVGEPGRRAVIDLLPRLKHRLSLDFMIVNGENSAGGRGITPKIAISLLRAGAAVITLGDHAWDQKEILDYIETEPRLLRPLNYPKCAPGQGSVVLETATAKVAVLNLQGRTYMNQQLENPFIAVREEVARLREEEGVKIIFLDFHAETTSEKIAMGRHLDGSVSAVIGTHTHVQTADERVFPGGTAFLCDAGMCGPVDSILGRAINPIIERMLTSMPKAMPVAKGMVRVCGAVIDVDPATGRALAIERLQEDWNPD
jgi:metallophosphoesterase (TIGR00282 family)